MRSRPTGTRTLRSPQTTSDAKLPLPSPGSRVATEHTSVATLQQKLLFAVMCLIWGSNWLALKVGTGAVPPGFFSGTRWTIAGLLLLGWRWCRRRGRR